MLIIDQIRALALQLLPTGRAFKAPEGGWLRTLLDTLAIGEARAYNDALAVLNAILPDNANFTVDDASDWEKRLGMVASTAPLATRKLAIARKMSFPGTIKARAHYLYIEGQLRAAGFDVYLHENRFPDGLGGFDTQSPVTVFGGSGLLNNQHGQFNHGQRNHGGLWGDIIANHIDLQRDLTFNVGANLRATFFICGQTLGTPAYVPANRRDEFRELILKLKPVQNVGYLFIIYL